LAAALAGGLVLYVLAFVIWALVPDQSDPAGRAFIGDLAFVVPGLVVAALAARAARSPGLSRQSRRAWTWLAFAFLAYWIGDVIFFVYGVLGSVPYPSLADAAYLAYYPLVLVGVASFPKVLDTRTHRVRFVLDALTVALGGGMVVWYLVLGPIAQIGEPHLAELLISVAYPIGDLVLLLGVAITVIRVPRELSRPALGLLVGGLLVTLVADLAFGVQNLDDTYESGRWVDALFLISWALLGMSAYRAYATRTSPAKPVEQPAVVDQVPLVPYLSVALGYGMLVAALRSDWSPTVAGLVIGAGALTGLVIARQVVAVRENMQLIAEREARRGEARFRSLVQNASDLIVVVDRDWAIRYETPSVERVLGYRLEDLQQTQLGEIIHPDDRAALAALSDGSTIAADQGPLEIRIARSDRTWMFVEASFTNLLDDPDIRGTVVTVRNVDDRKRLELKLTHQAYHDSLTNLANRPLFTEELDTSLAQSGDGRGPVSVLFLDVDNLKRINDSFGHEAGDETLIEIARRIRESTRLSDLVARLSGDEFAIMLERPSSEATAVAICDRILSGLGAPFAIDGVEVALSASIGIAVSTPGEESGDELLRRADAAMYEAKSAGKGRHVTFVKGMQSPARERLDVEAALRHSIERSEFEVYYQPIIDLRTWEVAGAESLIRWHRPGNGLVGPAEFIPIAEETGLIIPIGAWVLEQACMTAASWPSPTGAASQLSVSVNLSARQLEDPDLVGSVADILARTGLDPARLILEVTESLLFKEPVMTISRLRALKALGISVAIDDFGTGYSSLSYLRTLPVDEVKIDRSFVTDLDLATGSALVHGIADLSHSLGLTVVAEGVERQEHADALRDLGCEYAQGYLFARPMPAGDFTAYLSGYSPDAAGRIPAVTTLGRRDRQPVVAA
jgi:diguanylate cyclase (GGDEF)-like protein/PAS domain S-box-containing protein